MFFWLVAIPFFVIIAMFTLFRLPSDKLHSPEDIQDTGMAFRMVMQHDAAVKLMQRYRRDNESDMFNEGSYDLSGNIWKDTILTSGYLPSSFIPDTDNITTYIRCLNGAKLVASCRGALGVYVITAATPPTIGSVTTRWFEQKGAENLAMQLKKYEGSFPIKQVSLVLPEKPKKGADETDEDFAIRLAAYDKEREEYHLLKRSRYDLGGRLPQPDTVVGQVQSYPFDNGSSEARVIVRKIKAIGGEVVFENEDMPTDLPSGGEDSEPMDFNGEAIILSKSDLCKNGPCNCETGTDCGEGAYCLSSVCSGSCAGYGADEDRNCRNSCSSDSHCASGFYCESGSCRVKCTKDADCFSSKPYCNSGICGTTKVCTSSSQCPSSMPYCTNKICSVYPPSGTIMYKLTDTQFSSSINVIGSYTITAAGRYKIQMRGGFWSASPGGLTANVYYNKGISLTIKTIPGGWGCGTSVGIGLWAGGTAPVLVAGGGGYADTRDNCGGGGYVGGGIYWGINPNYHSAASGYSWNGSQGANMSTSGVGTGGSDWCCSNHYNTHSGYGGSGYCGSGYSCSNGSGINYSGEERYIQRRARIIITYCGPNSNSACP